MESKRVFQFHLCSPYIMAGLLFYCSKTCLFMLNNFYVGENTEHVLSPLLGVCNFNCEEVLNVTSLLQPFLSSYTLMFLFLL